ncbi:corrinoid protein [Sporomusa sp. KB1]|jgi:corrinoid protein of di/trimethylamine methyltransferase|uniref:corrinoid protein n=1 Tax=Sporomusa sp. KB1 TaxID=943346 RepID=UPI0011A25A5C|nr:corrinoid protein [Sporomusa sp. KB1]TWH46812.1 corrinoid protein of di/trimethylamine methyltransferase [Sporomusa sp. KB1]
MSVNKEELFAKLADAVLEMEEELAAALSKEVIENGVDAFEAIDQGLAHGMYRAGKLFEEEEYFVPELLMCSDAMNAGLDVLKPHLKVEEQAEKLKVVIGVVEGDTHDIGKNLVKLMLETSGFELIDLGRDVTPQAFVDKAKEEAAAMIAIGTLMTTTMDGMGEVIKILKNENIRDQFKVIVGGAPISQSFADKIGADGYASNAAQAVKLSKDLLSVG